MNVTKLPEKITTCFGKYKVFFGCIIPLVLFGIFFLFTKDLKYSKTIVLEILALVGFIIAIFVLENTEKNNMIVDNFLNELGNQELIIIENDLKILGNSICLSNISFENVNENKAEYSDKILRFNLAMKKYIDKYQDLNNHKEVQNFHRYMHDYNRMALLQDIRTYDSYIRMLEPLYMLISVEIDKKHKDRLKKTGDKK